MADLESTPFSAAFYVGYVEDEETPEMIMKKFQELDALVTQEKKPTRML